jgi:hypothetical protein
LLVAAEIAPLSPRPTRNRRLGKDPLRGVGQITSAGLALSHCTKAASRGKSSGTEKLISRALSTQKAELPPSDEFSPFVFTEIMRYYAHPASPRGAYARSSRYVRWGCGGRVGSQRDLIMPTNDIDADVKSCGPGLPVLRPSWRQRSRVVADDGGNRAGPRGDHV